MSVRDGPCLDRRFGRVNRVASWSTRRARWHLFKMKESLNGRSKISRQKRRMLIAVGSTKRIRFAAKSSRQRHWRNTTRISTASIRKRSTAAWCCRTFRTISGRCTSVKFDGSVRKTGINLRLFLRETDHLVRSIDRFLLGQCEIATVHRAFNTTAVRVSAYAQYESEKKFTLQLHVILSIRLLLLPLNVSLSRTGVRMAQLMNTGNLINGYR